MRGTFFVVCLFFITLFVLFLAGEHVIPSALPILCRFYLEKHQPCFVYSFLTTGDIFTALVSRFSILNNYTAPCFFLRESKDTILNLQGALSHLKTSAVPWFLIASL